jgi:hypothetical protein
VRSWGRQTIDVSQGSVELAVREVEMRYGGTSLFLGIEMSISSKEMLGRKQEKKNSLED